ncbi:WhiB family transcriptional regulator [Amycolatopsis sp. CA-230715]|uniref:WhiB family transcriptional regulator n=1 Tax=Amycolatopsis sp. CA-230715 TaxID=2745196 RepID=UPI001C02CA65
MNRLPEWRARATCRDRLDLDFIDPTADEIDQCRALCDECPVREKCLTDALTRGEPWGIWGGLGVNERAQLAEEFGHPPPAVIPCHGTNTRYAKHRCRCALCRGAHTEYERQRRARIRAKESNFVDTLDGA